ncbi:MAG: glycoside hydrolase family 97 N-terminal domain-containing protein, partial [Ignavibacteria bacterium]|nr:glycoside hydrolase family 97 N-terminal domain-containing protein [Ignavibacteria bacterium]
PQTIFSPNGNLSLSFNLTSEGKLFYQLSFKGKQIIKPSALGIMLKDAPSFDKNFEIVKVDTQTVDESWNPVWGEVKTIRNYYKELRINLAQKNISDRTLILIFRVFNDGLGFRYEFPSSNALQSFIVSDELTEFRMAGDHKSFWIPGDFDTNEYEYTTSSLREINATAGKYAAELSAHAPISVSAVQTPLMMKTADSLYINLHEAALVNYPAMNLILSKETLTFKAALVDDPLGNKAYLQTPAKTPWRTIVVGDRAVDILASKLILNLNEPSAIGNTDWIKPQKFVGVWWEMHVGAGSWNYADTTNLKLKDTDWNNLKPNGKHSATTARTKRYIDFAAQHGIPGVLVEGWDIGWEDWWGKWKEEVFDFVTPYPDFNVQELKRYAASKKVKLIMHHETSASATNYERRMDEAYRFMKENNYDAVKTGYVGRIIPRGEHHDGQWMVNHY